LRFLDLNFLEKLELKVINKIKDPATTGLDYTAELISDKSFNPSFDEKMFANLDTQYIYIYIYIYIYG
jgi:hypothetical protein